ncbi:MAG: AraC family transcriptional regulator [Chitinophagaceae bacterium]
MKALIQKIHVEENQSFACRTYRTPQFETNWHKHEECELLIITEGHGTALVGDYVGEYKRGDIFFLAGNLPHWFRKHQNRMMGSALVIHFKKNLWGEDFLRLPEMKQINQLLNSKNHGMQLTSEIQKETAAFIEQIDKATGIGRMNLLLLCLQKIGSSTEINTLTHDFSTNENQKENSVIEKIFDYSFKHYLELVTLQDVAAVAGMSIPTFCRFFKKNIKKSYFDFLQEIRISHACKLLHSTTKPVLEICYESGYNSWAHFSKQFKNVKQITPSAYRKEYSV